ncbi:MAG TPA: hypothetical protein VF384_00665 [Planctomycetota bacterium]
MLAVTRRCLAAAALPALAAAQATIFVPTMHPTIQGAILAAANGDKVVVLPGTYVERIDFLGKAITVQSASGATVTTIDGNSGGPTVTFATNEPPAAQLVGFTITNGLGTTVVGPMARSTAGGIQCADASPTIRGCVITGNHGGAGGLPAGGFFAGTGGPGGILASGSALRLIDCVIHDNTGGLGGPGTAGTPLAGRGGPGGAYFSFTVPGSAPEILRCTFTDNDGGDGGDAPGVAQASGGRGGDGGFELHATIPVRLTQCTIRGNTGGDGGTVTGTGGLGGHGAFDLSAPIAFAIVPIQMGSCAVVGNTGGNAGGGSNAFGGNGGGATGASRFTALGCTFAGNVTGAPQVTGSGTGGLMGGGYQISTFALTNCVLWGNTRLGAPSDLYVSGIVGQVNHSDLGTTNGTILGTGNLSIDPLFVNLPGGDVHLTAASPCRHAGTAAANMPLFDVDGDPRTVGPATDMGADEWDGLTGSREDLVLDLAVNGAFAPGVVASPAVAGNLITLRVLSPGGAFASDFTVVLMEPWLPPVQPVGPGAFPELHVPLGAPWLLTLPGGVGAAGVTLSAVWPQGLAGFALRFQAVAISPAARNTLFAATAARDLLL